jgi:Tol biopolymer transport system component
VYVGTDALQSQLVLVNREGAERPLTKASRQYANPRVSPDGRRVLTQTLAGELWIYDGQRETLSRLATPIPLVGFPLWMPNGREIIFKSSEGVHRLDVDGGRRRIDPQRLSVGDIGGRKDPRCHTPQRQDVGGHFHIEPDGSA